MNQIMSVWAALDMRKRIIVVGATLAMFLAVLGVARMASQPSMALLYAGLESGPAGDVIQTLEAQSAAFEVRGGAIYVDATRRDALRMTLASEGLPANSAQGYELLDNLSGFGTTSQMFDAAYWRAKEGELARTIVASPQVSHARVHIGAPSSQGFRQRAAPTGSVTVTTASGAVSAPHSKALKFLVASAVPGLAPEDVSVIDARGGLIMSGDSLDGTGDGSANRAQDLKRNIERLLEARVGFGNAVVEVNVETASESETILERSFDPESRVAISTETAETTSAANDNRTAGVTVASNLPAGDAAGGDGASSSNNTETRETVNYEVSETTREILRAPGTIRRISVAVLVDGIRSTDDTGGEAWVPRSDEELAHLQELVASAVGYDEARGDEITIKTLEFEPIIPAGAGAASGFFERMRFDVMSLIRLSVLAIVALVLGLFVIRPMLSAQNSPSTSQSGSLPAAGTDGANAAVQPPLPALTGEIEDGAEPLSSEMNVVSNFGFENDSSDLPALGSDTPDPVERLRSLIEERHDETVEILRGWMEDDAEGTA